MASALSAPHFHNEEAAFAYVEARIWPEGPTCPHCGGVERISKMQGKSTRTGLYKCYQCRKPFTVRMGSIFESSHVPLHIWLQAMYLIAGSKKGISSNQLHRTLGVTLKTAWFLSHRIREAMRNGGLGMMDGDGARVEADETYIGQKKGFERLNKERGSAHKMRVVSLIDRGTGEARSFPAMVRASGETVLRRAGAWETGIARVREVRVNGQTVVRDRQAAIADPTGGTTVDVEARSAVAGVLTALRAHGLIAP